MKRAAGGGSHRDSCDIVPCRKMPQDVAPADDALRDVMVIHDRNAGETALEQSVNRLADIRVRRAMGLAVRVKLSGAAKCG